MHIFKSQNVHPKYIIYWNQYFNFLQQPWLTIADLQVVLRGEELNCFQIFHESRNPPSSEFTEVFHFPVWNTGDSEGREGCLHHDREGARY